MTSDEDTAPNEGSIEHRLERIETILRGHNFHEPDCPANHDCARDHPEFAVYHYPQPCECWLAD